VHILALDTSDARGSVALLSNDQVVQLERHDTDEEYSSWLLPAVGRALEAESLTHKNLAGYAVAVGPGSFTGLRIGLTTVKAWSELFGTKIATVSRLEALASLVPEGGQPFVAAFLDAHRGQIFGALYRRSDDGLARIEEEMVISPERFLNFVAERVGGAPTSWVSPDGGVLEGLASWQDRERSEDILTAVPAVFAPAVGKIGHREILAGRTVDALQLDANYVRRSDAEIFWKTPRTAANRK